MRVIIASALAVLGLLVIGCSNDAATPRTVAFTEPAVKVELTPLANESVVSLGSSDSKPECGNLKEYFIKAYETRDFVDIDEISVKTLGATPANPSSTATYIFKDAPSIQSAFVVVSTTGHYDIHSGYVFPAVRYRSEVAWPQQASTEPISVDVDADDFVRGTHLIGLELCS